MPITDYGHTTLRKANISRDLIWNPERNITLSFRGVELAGEVGEACNMIKKMERVRLGIRGTTATLQELAQELADIIICVDLIAMGLGIDLDQAVQEKFNETSLKYGIDVYMKEERPCSLVEIGHDEFKCMICLKTGDEDQLRSVCKYQFGVPADET
jgi:NTP pyrophosphatase (non-canonical NTP hydrolase)